MNGENESGPKLVLDFIDPLFAIAVHISLAEGLMRTKMYDLWVQIGHLNEQVLRAVDWFDLAVLFLGYCMIVTSWFGYHLSVASKPIKLGTLAGKIRFAVDVGLLLIYCLLLTRFSDFTFVLGAICASFFLFVVWDQAKRHEYGTEEIDSARRRGVSVVWFFVFLVLLVVDIFVVRRSRAVLALAIFSTFLYRGHKQKPKLILEHLICYPFPA